MKIPCISYFPLLIFLECLCVAQKDFHGCLTSSNITSIYTPNNKSYESILQFSIQNLRFNTTRTPKPLVVLTPTSEAEIQQVIICAKKSNMHVRVRSGGHDYEGLSYVSDDHNVPFVIVDLMNFRNISVNVNNKSAWVGSGCSNGELYYGIAEKSKTLGFPSGFFPTVGIGGIFSGGGSGSLIRKYGLAADNIIDARLIDANGRSLDRVSMGEDHFWAIRGGGGNTFGLVVSWKIKLVDVSENVTFFNIDRTLEQKATKLVHQWQYVSPKLPKDLFIGLTIHRKPMIVASFNSLFLGGVDELLVIMQRSFPELSTSREDCTEMSWISSTLLFAGFNKGASLDVLLSKGNLVKRSLKAKSDYVQSPIPVRGLQGLWDLLKEDEAASALMIMTPYGGRMDEISESALPFPHRAGNLYGIEYDSLWSKGGAEEAENHKKWIRKLYDYMTPFVSKSPRANYVNFRDLDIGRNNKNGNITSYKEAKVWGIRYFKNNFDRLIQVKTKVDPSNFFRNEQSIPPLENS